MRKDKTNRQPLRHGAAFVIPQTKINVCRRADDLCASTICQTAPLKKENRKTKKTQSHLPTQTGGLFLCLHLSPLYHARTLERYRALYYDYKQRQAQREGTNQTAARPQSRENDANALFIFNSVIIPRALADAYTEEQRGSERGRRTRTAETQRKARNKQALISCACCAMMHRKAHRCAYDQQHNQTDTHAIGAPVYVYFTKRKRAQSRNTNALYLFIGKRWGLYTVLVFCVCILFVIISLSIYSLLLFIQFVLF